jgi:hypothetical protein
MREAKPDNVLLALGVLLLLLPLIFVVLFPEQFSAVQLYLRMVASLGGALIGAWLPGLLQIKLPGVRAGGALAVLVLFWQFDPPAQLEEALNADSEIAQNFAGAWNIDATE